MGPNLRRRFLHRPHHRRAEIAFNKRGQLHDGGGTPHRLRTHDPVAERTAPGRRAHRRSESPSAAFGVLILGDEDSLISSEPGRSCRERLKVILHFVPRRRARVMGSDPASSTNIAREVLGSASHAGDLEREPACGSVVPNPSRRHLLNLHVPPFIVATAA